MNSKLKSVLSEIVWTIRRHYPLAFLILFLGYIAEFGEIDEQLRKLIESGVVLPLMFIGSMYFIAELFCQGERRRKITLTLRTKPLKIRALYGINFVLAKLITTFAIITSIYILVMSLFPLAYDMPIKDSFLVAKFFFDYYYVLIFIPIYDWFIFKKILLKYLPEEKTWQEKSCFIDLIKIAWKNKIYSSLCLLILLNIALILL